MKKLLLLSGLLPGGGLFAQAIAVFAKGEFLLLDAEIPAPPPPEPARVALLAAYRADLARPNTVGLVLPAGPYDVRFYVKDTADFKIVLYCDFFKFVVE